MFLNMKITMLTHVVLAAAVALLAAGCGAVPDASKFSAAGMQLHSAVVVTGSILEGELRQAELDPEADDMNKVWAVPDACTLAMMQYGDALAGIVKASRDSAAAAQAVADAGAALASSVGVVLPPAAVSAEATKFAVTVYEQIQKERAARSLEAALVGMQPTVDAVGAILVKQLDNASEILVDANLLVDADMATRYQREIGYSQRLIEARQALYILPATAAATSQIDEIAHREQIIAPTMQKFAQEKAVNAERWKQQRQLIYAARQAVMEWAVAHRQLLIAVQNRDAVDPEALNESIVELRALIRKVKMS